MQKWNKPIYLAQDTHNHLVLNNKIYAYEEGMRVLLDLTNVEYAIIEDGLIPMTFQSDSDIIDGFSIEPSGGMIDTYKIFDSDNTTYAYYSGSGAYTSKLIFPDIEIYPQKAKIIHQNNTTNIPLRVSINGNTGGIYETITMPYQVRSLEEYEFDFSGNEYLGGNHLIQFEFRTSGAQKLHIFKLLNICKKSS